MISIVCDTSQFSTKKIPNFSTASLSHPSALKKSQGIIVQTLIKPSLIAPIFSNVLNILLK